MDKTIAQQTGIGIANEAIRTYETVKGIPYLYGGENTKGFDCSGFVAHVLGSLFPHKKTLFQTNVEGFINSELFVKVESAQPGDLIIFPKNAKGVNHIGIVINDTHWLGSQSSTGVAPVKLQGSWWSKNRPSYFLRLRISSAESIVSAHRGSSHVIFV